MRIRHATVALLLAVMPLAAPGARAGEPAAPASPPAPASPGWQERLARDAATPEAWKARAADIRTQILVSAGLWPPFDRPPLKPVVFGKLDRDGYSVEKVHFETWPGFHLTGNIYRPLGKKGPFPGVVSPHGHWKHGRFNDDKDGSVPGRALTLARLGCIVFSYDMVGYGDCTQFPHNAKPAFGDVPWGISLLGLQLWNSLRAVDFLCGLPDVDPKRIGATGASGGGTQTFLLTAVDDRVACAAPVCMVAGEFQGGCLCENAPLLRIGLNNVEIAAAAAPRPLLLVSATGDWTKDNPTMEAPAIRAIYERLGAPERFACVQQKTGHNYNKASREMVYDWFMMWLIQAPPPPGSKPMQVFGLPEAPFEVEKREALAVFGPDHPRPEGAVDRDGLTKVIHDAIRAQLVALRPKDAASLETFAQRMRPALQLTLPARFPAASDVRKTDIPISVTPLPDPPTDTAAQILAYPPGCEGVRITNRVRLNALVSHRAVLIAAPVASPSDSSPPLWRASVLKGYSAYSLDFAAPLRREPAIRAGDNNSEKYASTFYRSALAWRVQDTLTALENIATRNDASARYLVGLDDAGPAVLLARALVPPDVKVEKTIVDVQGIVDDDPASWTGAREQPGILRVGGLRTAGILAATLGGNLVIHNTQGKFDAMWIRDAFKAAGRENALTVSEAKWTTEQILQALK
jgi:dienelactone hydrolase